MKTIKFFITFLILSCTNIIFSQTQNKITVNVDTNWSGHMCNGGQGMCYINNTTNKSTSNTQVSFDKESKELTFIFSKTTLDETNKVKLLSNKLEENFYLYTFEDDFILPTDILENLKIKELTRIKQGNYLVKIVKDQIIMKLKLE